MTFLKSPNSLKHPIADKWLNIFGALVEWYWQGTAGVFGDHSVPVPLCPLQIPHYCCGMEAECSQLASCAWSPVSGPAVYLSFVGSPLDKLMAAGCVETLLCATMCVRKALLCATVLSETVRETLLCATVCEWDSDTDPTVCHCVWVRHPSMCHCVCEWDRRYCVPLCVSDTVRRIL